MELRPIISITVFLLLLAPPGFSEGSGSNFIAEEAIETDYPGPHTHHSPSPPGHFRRKPLIHQESDLAHQKFNGFNGGRRGGQVKQNQPPPPSPPPPGNI